MSLDKRIKVLTKLALDTTIKPSDRISAISQITSLLNDKVKDVSDGGVSTSIVFEQDTNKKEQKTVSIEHKNTDNIVKSNNLSITPVSPTLPTITDTITESISQPIDTEQDMVFTFSVDEDVAKSDSLISLIENISITSNTSSNNYSDGSAAQDIT